MIYLCEREIGFDTTEVGFPSIQGCRAVVILTADGLFGFHLNGSLSDVKKRALVNFVTGRRRGNAVRAIYAATTGVGSWEADQAKKELQDIAEALTYTGSIYWGAIPSVGSVYVHYQTIQNQTCTITWRTWNDANDRVDANRGDYAAGPDRAMANGSAPTRMYTKVDIAGLKAVYPTTV